MLAALAALVLIAGCFEDPVRETVEIEFLEHDQARITTTVQIVFDRRPGNSDLAARIQAIRDALANRTDDWSRRFDSVRPISESYQWEKSGGALDVVRHTAVVDPRSLGLFFGDTALSIFVTGDDGWRELAIYPGESNRASLEQRHLYDARLHEWTEVLARYLRSVGALYAWIREHPGRESALLSEVFSDVIPGEKRMLYGDLPEEEEALALEVKQRMEDVAAALEVPEGEAFSLNEIVRLVNDPFPAELRLKVNGSILEREGFAVDDEGLYVPRSDLWESLQALENRWVSPDPLVAWITASKEPSTFDLDEFVSRPRVVRLLPTASSIATTLEESLRPAKTWRVRWIERR